MQPNEQSNDPELPIETEPEWTVTATIGRWELRYDGKLHDTARGDHGRDRLTRIARHLNKVKAKPRPAIQCAADAKNPAAYIANHTAP